MPPLPSGCQLLWDAFLQLHHARGGAGLGPSPISPHDLLAYQQLHDVQFTPWEIDTLQALDRTALAAAARDTKTAS